MEVINIKKFNIALYEPEIPQNTGNIARLCACTGADLFLIGKLGFSLSDKYTKRAGLDYWDSVNIKKYDTLEELKNEYKNSVCSERRIGSESHAMLLSGNPQQTVLSPLSFAWYR